MANNPDMIRRLVTERMVIPKARTLECQHCGDETNSKKCVFLVLPNLVVYAFCSEACVTAYLSGPPF